MPKELSHCYVVKPNISNAPPQAGCQVSVCGLVVQAFSRT